MKFPRNARIFRGQLDASPFVGVLFLVAIFLLLNSSLVFMPGVAIKLPEGKGFPGVTGPTVKVFVDWHGQLYYESQAISVENLRLKLRDLVRRTGEPVTLVLLADKTVTVEMVVRLSELADDAGIKMVVPAVRPPAGQTEGGAVR